MGCHHFNSKTFVAVFEKISPVFNWVLNSPFLILQIILFFYHGYYYYSFIKSYRNTDFITLKLKSNKKEAKNSDDKERFPDEKNDLLNAKPSSKTFELINMTFSNKVAFANEVAFCSIFGKLFKYETPYNKICYDSPECQDGCNHKYFFVGEQGDKETEDIKEDSEEWYHY